MADPPRLTKTRCQMGRSENGGTRTKRILMMKANLKRGQQHPLKRRSSRWRYFLFRTWPKLLPFL